MDEFQKSIILKKINRTSASLIRNNMEFYYADTKEDVPKLIESLIKSNDIIASGGSVTLKECGVIEALKANQHEYLDREDFPADEAEKYYRAAFSADVYLTSANAITETGLLYNVDGNSNRIAAIAYGPKSVIVVAGYNKIVGTLDDAIKKVKMDAAPINAKRLARDTVCYDTGMCQSLTDPNAEMCDGCLSEERICCNYLVSAFQRHKNRIKVIIVGEVLGY